jgi:phage shock protein PspC (stress-responsive transcriptional regulator)/predicted membrane protein
MSDETNEDKIHNEPEPASADPESLPGGTRLHRSRTKKVFGGVAGGIGERFDVDPNIVRVVFVVLALVYGLGLAIYLALWALVPRTTSDDDLALNVDEVSAKRSTRWLRWAVLVGVIALFVIFLTNWQAHDHRVGPGLGGGVAVLWLVFLAILAVIAIRTSSEGLTFGRFLAFGFFAVITFLILTVGGFLILLQILGVPVEGGSGLKTWNPTSIAQVDHTYRGAYGSSTIDLSDVPFTSGTWSITATQGVGVLTVDVPRDAVVALRTHVGIGNVDAYTLGSSYISPFESRSSSVPAKNAPHLDLNLQVGIGQIDVVRTDYSTAPAPAKSKTRKATTGSASS